MADRVTMMARPQRWDTLFGPDMMREDVEMARTQPVLAQMDAGRFPDRAPLAGILKDDTERRCFCASEIVVREGDDENKVFRISDGDDRAVRTVDLASRVLGQQFAERKGFFEALTQLWTNSRSPEIRDPSRYVNQSRRSRRAALGAGGTRRFSALPLKCVGRSL